MLIDSLEDVETVTFSSEESIPVAKTTQPYTYLSDRCVAISDRYKDLARDHLNLACELAPPDDDESAGAAPTKLGQQCGTNRR